MSLQHWLFFRILMERMTHYWLFFRSLQGTRYDKKSQQPRACNFLIFQHLLKSYLSRMSLGCWLHWLSWKAAGFWALLWEQGILWVLLDEVVLGMAALLSDSWNRKLLRRAKPNLATIRLPFFEQVVSGGTAKDNKDQLFWSLVPELCP